VNVKGTSLVSTIRYIRETGGEAGWNRFVSRLAPPDRDEVDKGFLVGAWYPVDLMMRITRAACEEFGP
jgi:hypothetical protein